MTLMSDIEICEEPSEDEHGKFMLYCLYLNGNRVSCYFTKSRANEAAKNLRKITAGEEKREKKAAKKAGRDYVVISGRVFKV